jgi:hypothetical protein
MKLQKQLLTYHNESWKKLRIGTRDCPQKTFKKLEEAQKQKHLCQPKKKYFEIFEWK